MCYQAPFLPPPSSKNELYLAQTEDMVCTLVGCATMHVSTRTGPGDQRLPRTLDHEVSQSSQLQFLLLPISAGSSCAYMHCSRTCGTRFPWLLHRIPAPPTTLARLHRRMTAALSRAIRPSFECDALRQALVKASVPLVFFQRLTDQAECQIIARKARPRTLRRWWSYA